MIRRHRFEPARLVLGLALLLVAVIHLARALDDDVSVPVPALLALPGVGLLLAAAVAMVTVAARHNRASRRCGRDEPAVAGGEGAERVSPPR
ncbi:hypothetical protein [Streptomyces hainanensis]|uniref:Uncharacterized protein n=1 Tax=Streptomyces hainanensis TaxID=402648 RepID=A0A4R4TJD0_9ACTN|nr:hypothetical protein [Streptomyces hainanensis]TDC77790.1 hypothetical protein E1283_06515 [Streptomyces hainanensis]